MIFDPHSNTMLIPTKPLSPKYPAEYSFWCTKDELIQVQRIIRYDCPDLRFVNNPAKFVGNTGKILVTVGGDDPESYRVFHAKLDQLRNPKSDIPPKLTFCQRQVRRIGKLFRRKAA